MSVDFGSQEHPLVKGGSAIGQTLELRLRIIILTLLVSLQLAGHPLYEARQWRTGETHLTERKTACRECASLMRFANAFAPISNHADGLDVSSPGTLL